MPGSGSRVSGRVGFGGRMLPEGAFRVQGLGFRVQGLGLRA